MVDRGRLVFFMKPGAQEAIMIGYCAEPVRQRVSGIERERAFQQHNACAARNLANAMRNAPMRSPAAHALRILSVLQIMPSAQRRKDANANALAELD
jgi:hypothetical protein